VGAEEGSFSIEQKGYKQMSFIRIDGRAADEKRPLNLIPEYAKYADGSVLIELGDTRVLCTATIDDKVPPHAREMGHGWVTAEYAMLPRSSKQRIQREVTKGQIGGRTYEIQRLIGRSLRAVTDLRRLGERSIIIDCDVIQADGGTRTAAITGGFIALALAVRRLRAAGLVGSGVLKDFVAATSVGMVEGHPVLDLNYAEDVQADVDMNVVATGSHRFVEIQGTAEHECFDDVQLGEMLRLARKGIAELIEAQKAILGETLDVEPPTGN
jgi:ribonuclease PH